MVRVYLAFIVLFGLSNGAGSQTLINDQSPVSNFTPTDYSADPSNWDIAQDNRGIMYFGNSAGLLEFDGSFWRFLETPNEQGVYSLAVDMNGRVYIGGKNEIGYLLPDTLGEMRSRSLVEKIPRAYRDFGETQQTIALGEQIFFLTNNWLFFYWRGQISTIESAGGFYTGLRLDDEIYLVDGERGLTILEDQELEEIPYGDVVFPAFLAPLSKDRLLMLTQANTFYRFDLAAALEGKLRGDVLQLWQTDVRSAIENRQVYSLDYLGSGRFALGTDNGVFIFDRQGTVLRHINAEDGLQNNLVYDVLMDRQSSLWMALANGITRIGKENGASPSKTQEATGESGAAPQAVAEKNKFSTIIRRVEEIYQDSLLFGGTFASGRDQRTSLIQPEDRIPELPHDYNSLRFQFSVTNYEELEGMQYKTYLEGFDREGSEWRPLNEKEYTNIPPGDYTFHVQARDFSDTKSQSVSYSFVIAPPWYETGWYFWGQVFALLFGIVLAGILNKTGRGMTLSAKIMTIIVIVLFQYVYMAIYPFFSQYTAGIGLFRIILNVILGFIIAPAQTFLKKIFVKIGAAPEEFVEG